MSETITFCATGKTGLGHLRRIANVAGALRARDSGQPMNLLTNASIDRLPPRERTLFQRVEVASREHMARRLLVAEHGPVVIDTAVLPGLHRVDRPLCLILRETVMQRLPAFRLEGGRLWDLIVLPQPANEWRLDPARVPARRIEAVGYIYRRPSTPYERDIAAESASKSPVVLIASGGGSGFTASAFREEAGKLVAGLRASRHERIRVIQALGSGVDDQEAVTGIDAVWRPGADLHECFTAADLVITTAGYNSVLELACTDVPVLLVPITRTYDDQSQRSRCWEKRLGLCHRPHQLPRSVRWMHDTLARRRRRRPVDLAPSGAPRCAALLEELCQ